MVTPPLVPWMTVRGRRRWPEPEGRPGLPRQGRGGCSEAADGMWAGSTPALVALIRSRKQEGGAQAVARWLHVKHK